MRLASRDSNRHVDSVPVWDPLVRVSHWLLAAGFVVAYLTEGEPEWLHHWAGYLVAGLIAVRILWGVVGPRHARFSNFVTGPGTVLAYLRSLIGGGARRYLGHSPAGGAMTVALLLSLGLTTLTGMADLAIARGEGPLAPVLSTSVGAAVTEGFSFPAPIAAAHADEDDDKEKDRADGPLEEVHEFLANLSLFLVFLHLGGVALASFVHRENLPAAMVTGRKRA